MTAENFCYWLQGWFELNTTIDHRNGATKETLDMMKRHLDLVFTNVTKRDLDLGYKLIDTKFTGVSTLPLCGHDFPASPTNGLLWEPEYYYHEPSTTSPLPPAPENYIISASRGELHNNPIKDNTLYC